MLADFFYTFSHIYSEFTIRNNSKNREEQLFVKFKDLVSMPLFWRTLGTSARTRLRTSQSLSSFRHLITAMQARVRDSVTSPAQNMKCKLSS